MKAGIFVWRADDTAVVADSSATIDMRYAALVRVYEPCRVMRMLILL